jgi:hypothetical protein
MTEVLTWVGRNWLLLILWWLFGGGITVAVRHYIRDRRKHKLALREVELKIARARSRENLLPAVAQSPKPGLCVHRNVKPVISPFPEEKLTAWLCECGEQLPANWAVRAEDL